MPVRTIRRSKAPNAFALTNRHTSMKGLLGSNNKGCRAFPGSSEQQENIMQQVHRLDHDSLEKEHMYSFAIHVTPETLCQAVNCHHN